MVFTDFHCYSHALGIQTAAYVLLPAPSEMEAMNHAPIPTLYLLHGLSDDHTCWLRNTRIEQYARQYYVAVVMPAANRSFYTDMAHGAKYFSYISQELPDTMEAYYPLSKRRNERFAAGLSMGGYGAMKLALSCPQRYSAAASLSGSLEMQTVYRFSRPAPFLKEMDDIYGGEEALRKGDGNLWNLAQALVGKAQQSEAELPRLYVSCGTEDDLLPANKHFVESFANDFPMESYTGPGGHTWDFWDGEIQKVLAWLPLKQLNNVW